MEETDHASMLVQTLYSPVRVGHKELGVNDLLDRKYDAVLHSKSDRCSVPTKCVSTNNIYHKYKRTQSSLLLCLHTLPKTRPMKSVYTAMHEIINRVRTWKIRPSGEYVLADRSYPVPIEVILARPGACKERQRDVDEEEDEVQVCDFRTRKHSGRRVLVSVGKTCLLRDSTADHAAAFGHSVAERVQVRL